MTEELRKILRSWRAPEPGRRWPESCSFSTETLDGEDYDGAVDLVMSGYGRGPVDVVPRHELLTILSRSLATIEDLKGWIPIMEGIEHVRPGGWLKERVALGRMVEWKAADERDHWRGRPS